MKRARHHLKRRWIFSMGLVALAFYALGCATSPPTPPATEGAGVDQPSPASQELREIRVAEDQGSLNVVFAGSDAMRYTAFKAMDPLRLVVDLPNTEAKGVPSPLLVERGVVDKIETAVISRDPLPLTRVEIGLKQETPYDIIAEQDGIRVRFESAPPLKEAKTVEAEATNNPPADNPGHGAQAQQEAQPAAQPAVAPPASEKELAPATKLIAIQPFTTDQSAEIALVTDGKLPVYHAFSLTDPPRIVVDLMGITSGLDRESFPLSGSLTKKARIGKYKDKVRVVIDLVPAKGIPYEAVPGNDRLLLSLKPGAGFPAQPAATAATAAAAPAETVAAKGAAAVIKAIDFKLLESGQSRLTVTADRRLEPTVEITGANSLSLVLKNAELPKHLRRYIDTGQFASAVNVIDPRLARGAKKTVDIHVELREMVPYNLSPADSQIYLDFGPSTVPPPKPIELGKPVALTEGRTAPAVEAVAEPPAAPAPEKEVVAAPQEGSEEAEAVEEPATVQPAKPAVKAAPKPRRAEKPVTLSSAQAGYIGEPISLDLQDVDIRNVLRLLADVTGKNLVVEPDVKGRVTLKVDRVPWDQVLDLILKVNNLDKVLEGNVIRVATADKIRAEREQRLAALEAEQKRLAATKDVGEISTAYLQVNYADSKNIASQIDKMKSDKGTLSVDDRTNLIIYSDYPKRVENARLLMGRLDRATPQVMIESRIVEASTNFSRDLGIQWGGSYWNQRAYGWGPIGITGNQGLTGTTVTNPPSGFPQPRYVVDAPVSSVGSLGISLARFSSNSIVVLDMKLMALEGAGEIKLVSAPRIFTLDNVEAMIQQGEQIPYPQQSQDGISTAFVPATLSLTVTPHITPDDRVRLQVKVKNDFADFGRTVNGTPAINTREAKTELLVNSGDTIVIGGIIKQDKEWSEQRVPFLSKIPGLSWLFKSRTVQDNKSELLIFLSPTILRDGKTAA
ncbi:MAG TPA: type IV pilus secretin PilQ [Syntrophobacteria bacterium]|nr:type IV pilus secretin PilQ [Syntrophobacteria bacterium]